MKRSFNYTNRIALNGQDYIIKSAPSVKGTWIVHIQLLKTSIEGKSKNGIPAALDNWIEVYSGAIMQRFKMGQNSKDVWEDSFETTFKTETPFLLRIKMVLSSDPDFKIWAMQDQINPNPHDVNGQQISMLPVHYTDKLEYRLWALNFDSTEGIPTLEINNKLKPYNGIPLPEFIRTDPMFRIFVLPEVYRQILIHEIDNETGIWMDFTRNLIDVGDVSDFDSEEQIEFINKAVDAFCAKNQLIDEFNKFGADR